MTHRHSLLDVIECSWWPNDGPVHLRGLVKPIEVFAPIAMVSGRANKQASRNVQPRIVRTLVGHVDGLSCAEIARRLDVPFSVANDGLLALRKSGLVDRLGGYNRDVRWRIADDDVADVALDAEEAA